MSHNGGIKDLRMSFKGMEQRNICIFGVYLEIGIVTLEKSLLRGPTFKSKVTCCTPFSAIYELILWLKIPKERLFDTLYIHNLWPIRLFVTFCGIQSTLFRIFY